MATLPQIFAVNLTGSPITLDRLGRVIPSSSTIELTTSAFVEEIREDESLYNAISAGNVVLSFGDGNLTKAASLNFFNIVPLEVRLPVRALSDTNIGSLSGTTTVDGVALNVNDRVLLTGQSTGTENGIWVVKAGAWERPQDFDTDEDASSALIAVQEGATYGDQVWQCTSNQGSAIVGTSPLTFGVVSGEDATLQSAYEAGNTINVTAAEGDIALTLTSANFTVDGTNDVRFGSATPLDEFTVDARAVSLDATDDSNLSMVANNAANKTLSIAASNVGAGDADLALTADGSLTIDGDNGIELNSAAGNIGIGNDADTGAISIGTGAATRAISVGNGVGATSVVIASGTGGINVNSNGPLTAGATGNSNVTADQGDLLLSTTTTGNVNVSSADDTTIAAGGVVDVQAAGNVTIGSLAGKVGIGADASTGDIDIGTGAAARNITIGNKIGATGVTVETGTGELLVDSPTTTLTGNLVVQGTTTTVNSQTVNVKDQYLYLNDGYETTGSPRDGGFVVNVDPQATNDAVAVGGFTAGVAAVSNPTVVTASAATFSPGDFIQIAGANNQENDGLYEVVSHVGTTLTVAGVGVTGRTFQFVQNQFVTDGTVAGTIRKVRVGVYRVNGSGIPQFGFGDNAITFTFDDIATGGALTLQDAYEGGNTIITTAADGNVIVAGTEALQVSATGGLDVNTAFNFDGMSFEVHMSGFSGFSIYGNGYSIVSVNAATLILSTTTSGEVIVDGASGVEINASGGAIDIGNDANAQPINVGTGAAARAITVGNTTGTTGVVINTGSEQIQLNGVTDYGKGAGIPTPRAGGFQDGDRYYDTALDMEMRYDAGRAKWLSVETMTLMFGRRQNTNPGQFYRGGSDGQIMSATIGYPMPFAGTIVGLGYTRSDSDNATFDVVEDGVSRATLASAATSGRSRALDGDVSAGGIVAVRNQAGGNQTSNVIGWVQVKFRST